MNSNRFKLAAVLSVGVVCISQSAFAHPGHGVSGFAGGFAHPLLGADHVLAMLAVGIWAAQLGGGALWMVPCAFVGLMAGGGALGMASAHSFPIVESGIAVSVLVLGLMIAMAVKAPLYVSVPLVGLFAMFHGYAHGTELSEGMSAAGYSVGFMFATAALHAAGIGMGLAAKRALSAPSSSWVFRTAGAAIMLAGVALMIKAQ